MYEWFICHLIDSKGKCLAINLLETSPAYMDMLNTLCGAPPVIWIDRNSQDKVIRLDNKLRLRMSDIVRRHIPYINCQKAVFDFLDGIHEDGLVAFLRGEFARAIDEQRVLNARLELQKFEFSETYDINDFGNALIYTGYQDLKQCVCRFCKRKYPQVNFKKKNAHAIPEALGNKTVFCNDECMGCNHSLANVEKNLINYLNFRRADAKIPGKRGKVSTNTGQNYVNDGKTGKIEISDEAIIGAEDGRAEIKYLDANLITHPGIYRALSKIAIDLIPNEILPDFERTIEWIKGNLHPHTLPDVIYSYRSYSISQPIVKLFIKRDVGPKEYPRCIVCLDLIDLRFYYMVPFAKSDELRFLKSDCMEEFMLFLVTLDKESLGFERIDMSQREGKYSHVISHLNPDELLMVEKERFDCAKERNPNKVDFPPLNKEYVNVIRVKICELVHCGDLAKLHDFKIEHSSIDIEHLKVWFKKGCFFILIKIHISIVTSGEILFSTKILATLKHAKPNMVYSTEQGEISYYLVEYMVKLCIRKLKERLQDIMPNFDFQRLPLFIIENHLYVLPKE